MKVALDVRMIENSGIGTVIRGFLDHLPKEHFNELLLFSKPGWKNPYPCEHVSVPYNIYSITQHWAYGSLLKKHSFSFFHMPHYDVPYFYSDPYIATVHDLIHLKFPQYSTKPFTDIYAAKLIGRVVKKSKKIVTISENTKKDIFQAYPQAEGKVVVIPPGLDESFSPASDSEVQSVLNHYQISSPYLLYIGNLRPSKNTDGLIQAYVELRKKRGASCPPLVLAGQNSLKAYKNGFPDGIQYIGKVKKEELSALYSGALIFLFPSFYEGFGLPPVEAMACGTPVVVSDRASIPEVCADAAVYVNPDSTSDMVNKINNLIDDKPRQQDLVKKGFVNAKRFPWKKNVEETWKLYETLA